MSIPKRSKALRAASKNFRWPQRHPACFRARSRQGQAAFGGGCAILDASCARQHGFVQGRDEGMTTAEQRNGCGATYCEASMFAVGPVSLDIEGPNREAAATWRPPPASAAITIALALR